MTGSIAYVLGLSHALNIAFFTALADSGEAAPALAKLSSTTFDEQLAVARKVSDDNPSLYFEIQSFERIRHRVPVGRFSMQSSVCALSSAPGMNRASRL